MPRKMRPHIPVPLIQDGIPASGSGVLAIVHYLPPAALSPNSRDRWGKIKAVKSYRTAIEFKVREMMGLVADHGCPWPRATMEIHWYHATNRFPDFDNAAACHKSSQDGAARAGIVGDDKHIKMLPVEFFKDPTCPRVVLIFRRREQ